MSEAKEQNPKLPRPKKDETVENFIKNVLSETNEKGEPLYPDLINLAASEVFDKMDKDPAYSSVVAEEAYIEMKAMFSSPEKEGEPKEDKDVPKPEDKPVPKAETVAVVPDVTVDALKAVEETSFIEPLDASASDDIPSLSSKATTSVFEPDYRIENRSIKHRVTLEQVGPLATTSTTPLDDLLTDVSEYDLTKKRDLIFSSFVCQFVTPCTIEPLTKDTDEILVPMDAHALQPTTARSKYLLTVPGAGNVRRPIYDVNADVDKQDPFGPRFVERMVRTRDDYFLEDGALNLSPYAYTSRNEDNDGAVRGNYQEAEGQSFQCSPHRYSALMCGMRAFKYLYHTLPELQARNGYQAGSAAERSLKRNELGDVDQTTNDFTTRTLYARFSPGNALSNANAQLAANHFFREEVVKHLGVDELYAGVMDRSLRSASSNFSHITPGTANFSIVAAPGLTNHRALAEIASIPSSAGAEMMRQLGGVLCGGLGTHLTFNFDPRPASSLSTPLCCAASMLLFDNDMLDFHTLQNLIAGMLAPFYPESSLTVQNHTADANGNYQTLAGTRTILCASDISIQIIDNIQKNPLTAYARNKGVLRDNYNARFGAGGSQNRIKTYIVERLASIFSLYSASRIFVDVELKNNFRLFDANVFGEHPIVMCPFLPRDNSNLEQSILLGTATHSTNGYVAGGTQIFQGLMNFVEILDFTISSTKAQPLTDTFKSTFDNANGSLHLAKSQAVFTDALFKCIYDKTDILPMARGMLPQLGQAGVKSAVLPLEGALSFIIHGINSASVNEQSTFVPFERSSITALPSRYPMYLYLERAITQELHDTVVRVKDGDVPMLFMRVPELVDVVLKSLKRIYKAIDPESEDRVKLMLYKPQTYLVRARNAVAFVVPPELKYPSAVLTSKAVSEDSTGLGRIFNSTTNFTVNGMNNAVTFPSFENGRVLYKPLFMNNVFMHCLEHKSSKVKDLYICVDGLDSFYFKDRAQVGYMMYGVDMNKVRPENTVDILEVMRTSVHTMDYNPTLGKILAMVRRGAVQRDFEWPIKYVRIPEADVSYVMQELSSDASYVNESSEVQIAAKTHAQYFKYEVKNMPIYFRKATQEYADLARGEFGPINETWMAHLGMSLEYITNRLVTSEGVTEELNSADMFHPRKRSFKLVDGSGFVHSTNMTFTSRDSDKYTIKEKVDTFDGLLQYLP